MAGNRTAHSSADRKNIPEADRLGFIFHATDIYHGSGYFDRRKPEWSDENRRIGLLNELADIIDALSLPVVFGAYEKNKFTQGPLALSGTHQQRSRILHDVAVIDCLIRADKWLARFAPNELATVVHEDGTPAKRLIKFSVRFARSEAHLRAQGFEDGGAVMGFPIRRIIDTVHFADKADARPLQLADLCGFMLGRMSKDKPVPRHAAEIMWKHLRWILKDNEQSNSAAANPSDISEEPLS